MHDDITSRSGPTVNPQNRIPVNNPEFSMVLPATSQEALDHKASRRPNDMEAEIPVWVNNRQRWVTGIGRKTTCDDVISVLLRDLPGTLDPHGFVIMERWRRVERPLDSRSRILKVWNAWGDAQGEVRLTLRRVDGEADSGRGSPTSTLNRRRRHHHRNSKLPWPSHQTLHPRRLAQLHHQTELNKKLPETIERLMKLILAQGETIQNQLRRLQDREHQIEHLEDETHRSRVEALGSNYLLETYLGSNTQVEGEEEDEKGNDSGVVTEVGSDQASPVSSATDNNARCQPSNSRLEKNKDDDEENFADESDVGTKDHSVIDDATMTDLRAQIELWEKLVKVNKRLEREEECLVRLHIKFRRYRSKQNKEALRVLPEEELDQEGCQVRDSLMEDLERTHLELERGAKELEHTSLALAETEALVDARRHYLRRLQAELEASDKETDRLQHQIIVITTPITQQVTNDTGGISKSKQDINVNDTDSNSDTGLSSLHSGSEEGVYILDTLV
ncbi:ras association domain-containing protein 10 [Anabrus simplex]|uniref:ras association domain-containing protein 10 n=1 Tax=Anabrus simplex TaxID=316456 RepID=UPI0035A356D0